MPRIDIKELQKKQDFLNLCHQVTHEINDFLEDKYFKESTQEIPAGVFIACFSEILAAHMASFIHIFKETEYLPKNLKAIELRTAQFLEALKEDKKDGMD